MKVEQFVMAYCVEQDRIRAMLPEGFESLRPVLRINTEIRAVEACGTESGEKETIYIEFNTPVAAFGKRGWLNIGRWESPETEISCERRGKAVTFRSPFLEITYTGVGIEGGCPAERDNDGCFFFRENTGSVSGEWNFAFGEDVSFVTAERIDVKKEFCDCAFAWSFTEENAHGVSIGGTSAAALPEEPKHDYEKQVFSSEYAASIECEQILGSYVVRFERK